MHEQIYCLNNNFPGVVYWSVEAKLVALTWYLCNMLRGKQAYICHKMQRYIFKVFYFKFKEANKSIKRTQLRDQTNIKKVQVNLVDQIHCCLRSTEHLLATCTCVGHKSEVNTFGHAPD